MCLKNKQSYSICKYVIDYLGCHKSLISKNLVRTRKLYEDFPITVQITRV